MNIRPTLIGIGDRVFLTPEGYKYYYINGYAKTLQDATVLLAKHTVESVDTTRGTIKLALLDLKCRVEHVFKQIEPGPTDHPEISVFPDLTMKGVNSLDLLGKKMVVCKQPVIIGRMPGGTQGGNSTVFIVLEYPATGETVVAETTMKLFLDAADKLRKFDDPKRN